MLEDGTWTEATYYLKTSYLCGHYFLYLAVDVIGNCICEIQCLALDGFDLNTAHKQSCKEKKSWQTRDLNPGLLGGKQECFLCGTQKQPPDLLISSQQQAILEPVHSIAELTTLGRLTWARLLLLLYF